jgi:quercetin dioxygenase-like cupin family protein
VSKKPDGLSERAALYALGSLSEAEARAFEAEIESADADTEAALQDFRAVVADLAYAAVPEPPPPSLRARVLERIGAESPAVFERDGSYFARGQRIDWLAGRGPGIEVKLLGIDVERGRRTVLIRMAPGTVYPAHRHVDLEEIYLLEGDYLIAGVLMHAGDYCRAGAGTVHHASRTLSGCTFIVTTSLQDQPAP